MPEMANNGCDVSLRDNGYRGAQPIFDEVFTFEHLMLCAHKCGHGVRWKASVQMFEIDQMQWVSKLYEQIHSGTFRSKGFQEFWLKERGKDRFIQSVHVTERCVQKCLTEYCLKPVIVPRLIYDNGASLQGKGTDFSLKRLRRHLTEHYRRHQDTGGILLMDYKDYFNSIPHEPLIRMLRAVISDDRLFDLTKYFIKRFGDKGLGLGSEISQICAVYYPNSIDHYIKEHLHIKGYGRYMDDAYLIHEDIDYLRYCLTVIKDQAGLLGLTLNPKTQIVHLDHGFTFLKRRFSYSDTGGIVTRLRRENITKRRKTLRKQKRKSIDIRQSYASWRGYANKWDSKRTIYHMDKEVL